MKHNCKKKIKDLSVRFTPYAWAKLLYMRDQTHNEVGAFGITDADDLLLIKDIAIIEQKVSVVTTSFDDEAVADFFEDQVELGRKPDQFARIWLHTHPGPSCRPSFVDEQTFERVFGSCDWSIMFILATDNKSYCRLQSDKGPLTEATIPVEIDYDGEFEGSDHEAWEEEYDEKVTAELQRRVGLNRPNNPIMGADEYGDEYGDEYAPIEIKEEDPATLSLEKRMKRYGY